MSVHRIFLRRPVIRNYPNGWSPRRFVEWFLVLSWKQIWFLTSSLSIQVLAVIRMVFAKSLSVIFSCSFMFLISWDVLYFCFLDLVLHGKDVTLRDWFRLKIRIRYEIPNFVKSLYGLLSDSCKITTRIFCFGMMKKWKFEQTVHF